MYNVLQSLCSALVVCALVLTSGIARPQSSLNTLLEPYLAEYELPAVAAAVARGGRIVASGAVGTRRTGETIPVSIHDRWHIGSDTKAFTAMLAGMAVDSRKLRWDSTLGEVFRELADAMEPRMRAVTLTQLLSHTSGLPGDNPELYEMYLQSSNQQDALNMDEMRYWLVQQVTKRPLHSDPGTTFTYANVGYVVAGAMVERVEGRTWEELIRERIFAPLQLETAGLGCQSTLGKVDAPLGHALVNGVAKPMLAGPYGDVWPVIGPAGNAHMSVLDFARWGAWHAAEAKRLPALVMPDTAVKLHTPVIDTPPKPNAPPGTPKGGGYALGWGKTRPVWARNPLLTHNGSNDMNLAQIWIDTKEDLAIVILTNIGGPKADAAVVSIARKLYNGEWKKQ